ncbi:MAG: transcription antitermination factor NusB [Gammaproteobacteria bacterium]|nr:transcription antitermination factor NusB [Gammaproteobacteria bacterium]
MSQPNPRHLARERTLQALYQWQLTGLSLVDIEQQFILEQPMKGVEMGYFRELLHQIPAVVDELDALALPYLDRPLDQIDPIELSLIRIGIYELKMRLDVPYRVVINEGVMLAKAYAAETSHRYINGILDNAATLLRAAEVNQRHSGAPVVKTTHKRRVVPAPGVEEI